MEILQKFHVPWEKKKKKKRKQEGKKVFLVKFRFLYTFNCDSVHSFYISDVRSKHVTFTMLELRAKYYQVYDL